MTSQRFFEKLNNYELLQFEHMINNDSNYRLDTFSNTILYVDIYYN